MDNYEQQGGQSVPPQQSYQDMPVRPLANNMTVLALIFAVLAILTVMTGILPIFFGSLSILFAILSKGSSLKMDSSGKISTALATFSMIAGLTVTGFSIYEVTHNPEVRDNFNATFKQMYGVTFDEYMEGMQEFYETGKQPDFMENGTFPGKVDTL